MRTLRPGTQGIYDDYPENDENTLYIPSNGCLTLDALVSIAKDHFGHDVYLSDLEIEFTKLHTRCVTYDMCDSSDWDDYIIISRV